MLFFSLIIFTTTITLYFYENHLSKIPTYKLPSLKYNSLKYKNIKNISPVSNSDSYNLLILSDDEYNNNCSILSILNTDTGEITQCRGLELYKTLDDRIFSQNLNSDTFSLISNEGLLLFSTNIVNNNGHKELYISTNTYPIEDIKNVTDILFDSYLYYIKKTDKLIHYEGNVSSNNKIYFSNNINKKATYYKKPYSLISSNYLDEIVYYTKHDKSGLNLYLFSPRGYDNNSSTNPIVKNFIYGKSIQSGDGICGIYSKDRKFNLFFKQRRDKNIEIDAIPMNTDMLGQIPDICMTTYNQSYIFAYSSFDENHMGKISIKTETDNLPKVVIENEPIIGPIKLYEYNNNNKQCYKILFSTLENNNIKIKFYNVDNKKIEDLTHFFN